MADENKDPKPDQQDGKNGESKKRELPDVPPVRTQHQIVVDGRSLSYTATVGMI